MDICKCIHCEHHDVNTKTTFCKLNNESTFTDNDIPCPLEVESDEISNIVHNYINRGIVSDYDRLNCPKPPIYIGPVKVKTLRDRIIEESAKELQNEVDKLILQKEETKMNATSTETFHDIIAVDFELQTFPNPDVEDKFIVSATNRDDIFCFVFEGPNIVDACRQTGLFTGWEKDQRIRELEKENKQNKEAADCWSNEYYNLSKKFDKLKEENERLEKLKTPTIENFADEEPSDNVNHPSHYTGKYECIDVMQDVFGNEATDNFCLCNAFKYIWRARKKNGLEDVKKAVWYLNKYIEEAENGVQKGEQV